MCMFLLRFVYTALPFMLRALAAYVALLPMPPCTSRYPWEDYPHRSHSQSIDVGPFYIGKYPVTCGDYAKYLAATGYTPRETYNWLANWKPNRSAPATPNNSTNATAATSSPLSPAAGRHALPSVNGGDGHAEDPQTLLDPPITVPSAQRGGGLRLSMEPPADLVDVPVTYVSQAEAAAYCAWAHKGRLPQSYEWQ